MIEIEIMRRICKSGMYAVSVKEQPSVEWEDRV